MSIIKINNQEYEVTLYTRPRETNWGNRESKEITIPMTYEEVKGLFVDNLIWSEKIIQYNLDGTQTINERDMSEYALSGPITDNRNGTVTIRMGKYTQEELLRIPINSSPQNHQQATQMRVAIQEAIQSLPEQKALGVKILYPSWQELVDINFIAEQEGFKFLHNNELYKTLQPNQNFVKQWVPGSGTEAIFVQIDEAHAGTLEDPIPYNGNMILEEGKYYIQDSTVYLCNRNTGNAVYHALEDLIGLYVQKV